MHSYYNSTFKVLECVLKMKIRNWYALLQAKQEVTDSQIVVVFSFQVSHGKDSSWSDDSCIMLLPSFRHIHILSELVSCHSFVGFSVLHKDCDFEEEADKTWMKLAYDLSLALCKGKLSCLVFQNWCLGFSETNGWISVILVIPVVRINVHLRISHGRMVPIMWRSCRFRSVTATAGNGSIRSIPKIFIFCSVEIPCISLDKTKLIFQTSETEPIHVSGVNGSCMYVAKYIVVCFNTSSRDGHT